MTDQERVHGPSPIRLMQAKEEGRVAKSGDLSRGLVTCFLLGSLFVFGGSFQSIFAKQIRSSLSEVSISYVGVEISKNLISLLLPLGIYLIGLVAISLVAWHLQSPLCLRFEKASPDFSRMSLGNAWGRLFSPNQLFKILTWILGLGILLGLALMMVWRKSAQLVSLASIDLEHGLQMANDLLRHSLVGAGAIILLLGVVDYFRERIRIALQLRMSDQERREEARNSEMNPEIRRRMLG